MSPELDRATAYGDGLFETMRVFGGRIPFWPEHQARLELGAARLGLRLPTDMATQVSERAAGHQHAVLKLIVAASGDTGYRRAWPAATRCAWSARTLPASPAPPVAVRWCRAALAIQPLLAGFKHLNRLEQVLARSEWSDDSIYEGLVCDLTGHVIEATQMGLLVLEGRTWLTPLIDRCGVLSVVVARLIDQGLVVATRLERQQVEAASAVALVSSIRGVVAVDRLEQTRYGDAESNCAELKARVSQWMGEPC